VRTVGGGVVLQDLNPAAYRDAVQRIAELRALEPAGIRARARRVFALERAVESYRQVYARLAGEPRATRPLAASPLATAPAESRS